MTRWLAIVVAIALTPACNQKTAEAPNAAENDPGPYERVVTLAPHLAEFVFVAGAGDKLVGVSAYSDFPPEVARKPMVSDAFTVDQEQLALLEPDLVLAWKSGTPVALVDELRNAGYNVQAIETRTLDDVSAAILEVATLVGASEAGARHASRFEAFITKFTRENRDKPTISVFYQVSSRPLYTVSSGHYISQIIELCGGRNIFEGLSELAPAITVEAVVERDPEVLLAGSVDGSMPFDDWKRWPNIAANRMNNHFVVSADEIGRPSMRLISAANAVCVALDEGRKNREGKQGG